MLKGPTNNSYEELKATYLQRRTPTTAERVQRLRALGPLGDRRPSDLLRLIERILGRSIQGDDIATEEFLMRLPGQTQLIVRAQADVFTVEQLAKMADRLISVPGIQSGASVAELHQPTPAPDEPITLASLHRQLSTLASNSDKMSYELAQLKKAHTCYLAVCREKAHPTLSDELRCSEASMTKAPVGITWRGVLGLTSALTDADKREMAAQVVNGE